MADSGSTLVHDVRNQLSAILMFISLLGKVELPGEIHIRLSVSAEELRTVLTEPDLAAATHHDLNAMMDAFSEVLRNIEITQLPEEFVLFRTDIIARIPITIELWSSLTQL